MLRKFLFLLLLPGFAVSAGAYAPNKLGRVKADLDSALKSLFTRHVNDRKYLLATEQANKKFLLECEKNVRSIEVFTRKQTETFNREALLKSAVRIAAWQEKQQMQMSDILETSARCDAAEAALQQHLQAGSDIFRWMIASDKRLLTGVEQFDRSVAVAAGRESRIAAADRIISQMKKWDSAGEDLAETSAVSFANTQNQKILADAGKRIIQNHCRKINAVLDNSGKSDRKDFETAVLEQRLSAASKISRWMANCDTSAENRQERESRMIAETILAAEKKNILQTVAEHRKAGLQLDYRRMLMLCTGDYSEPEGNGMVCNYAKLEKFATYAEIIRTSNDLEEIMRSALALQNEVICDEQLMQIRQMKNNGDDRQAIAAIRNNLRLLEQFGQQTAWQMQIASLEIDLSQAKVDLLMPGTPADGKCRIVYHLRKNGGNWLVYRTEQDCKEIF